MNARRIGMPRPVAVTTGPDGAPLAVGRARVGAVREEWVVEDRWWTGEPLRRRYLEVVLDDGAAAVVFHDLVTGAWFAQRG